MKTVGHIVLLARDVPIKLPYSRMWNDTKNAWKTFGAVGVHGCWSREEGGYVCPMILFEEASWMNIASTTSEYSCDIVLREDKDAIYGDFFEEVVLKLQLDGTKRNVFEIPQKVLQVLEKKSIEKNGRWNATSFVLPFKWLKTKCKRVI